MKTQEFDKNKKKLQKLIEEYKLVLKTELSNIRKRKSKNNVELKCINSELRNTKKIMNQLLRKEFEIVFAGITKSGKTSIINALLRTEILPSSNVPTTSHIIKIKHEPGLKGFRFVPNTKVYGQKKVKKELLNICNRIRSSEENSKVVIIETQLPFISEVDDLKSELIPVIIDTPGVTESDKLGRKLSRHTFKALENCDLPIFVMNYSYLKTNGEYEFFKVLKKKHSYLIEARFRKCFVLLTHCDLRNRNDKEISKVRTDIAKYIANISNNSEFESSYIVKEINGKQGLLSLMGINGIYDSKAHRKDLIRILFGKSPEHINDEMISQSSVSVLTESGISGLESLLKSLSRYCLEDYRIKVILLRLLESLTRIRNKSFSWMNKSNSSLNVKTKRINKNINLIIKKISKIKTL